MDDDLQRLSESDLKTKLDDKMKERMLSVAIAIEARYKRAEVLRKAIMKAPYSSGQPAPISNVEQSRNNWMNSQKFKYGIQAVRRRRKRDEGGHRPTDRVNEGEYTVSTRTETGRKELQSFIKEHQVHECDDTIPDEMEEEEDVEMEEDDERINPVRHESGELGREEARRLARRQRKRYHLEREVKAHFIQFSTKHETDSEGEDTESFLTPTDDPLPGSRFNGTFPDQNISMSLLLNGRLTNTPDKIDPHGDWNVLSRGPCKDRTGPPTKLQHAIANYYEEDYSDLWRPRVRRQTPTQRLISPEL
ncbi:hypothetical protein N0V85_002492 [Neurospora sp. IMI 360204]|nr:hypothetical protein N0V85_002492 [Neurospora sp. IMI 360204]